jgi:hypothetical protein
VQGSSSCSLAFKLERMHVAVQRRTGEESPRKEEVMQVRLHGIGTSLVDAATHMSCLRFDLGRTRHSHHEHCVICLKLFLSHCDCSLQLQALRRLIRMAQLSTDVKHGIQLQLDACWPMALETCCAASTCHSRACMGSTVSKFGGMQAAKQVAEGAPASSTGSARRASARRASPSVTYT